MIEKILLVVTIVVLLILSIIFMIEPSDIKNAKDSFNKRPKTIILIVIVLLSWFSFECSSKDSITFGMITHHKDRETDYNERDHQYLGYQHNNYFLHTFKNSNRRRSVYLGVVDKELLCFNETVCVGGDIGVITGYDFNFAFFPIINTKINKSFDLDIVFGLDQVVALKFIYKLD